MKWETSLFLHFFLTPSLILLFLPSGFWGYCPASCYETNQDLPQSSNPLPTPSALVTEDRYNRGYAEPQDDVATLNQEFVSIIRNISNGN